MPKTKIFQGENGDWYWRLRAKNGRIIAIGGEGFKTKWGATRALKTVQKTFAKLEIEDED